MKSLKYKCMKCGYLFQEVMSDKFIKTSLPTCGMCHSNSVMLFDEYNNDVENKKNK